MYGPEGKLFLFPESPDVMLMETSVSQTSSFPRDQTSSALLYI